MKLWVAICVPDAENARQIAVCTVAALRKQAVETGIRVYNSPSALRRELAGVASRADVVILAGGSEGFQLGQAVCDACRNAILIFTGGGDHIMEAFRYRPVAYLPEAGGTRGLVEALGDALRWRRSGAFRFEAKAGVLQIPLDRVDYFESDYRNVLIHLVDNTTEKICEKLDCVENGLQAGGFCRCHKSYLVNLSHIRAFRRTDRAVLFYSGNTAYASKALQSALLSSLSAV